MHVWRFASCMSPTGLDVRGATGGCHGFTECKFVNEVPSIYGAGGVAKTRGTLCDSDGFLFTVSAVTVPVNEL